jgi:hypothetical protein
MNDGEANPYAQPPSYYLRGYAEAKDIYQRMTGE